MCCVEPLHPCSLVTARGEEIRLCFCLPCLLTGREVHVARRRTVLLPLVRPGTPWRDQLRDRPGDLSRSRREGLRKAGARGEPPWGPRHHRLRGPGDTNVTDPFVHLGQKPYDLPRNTLKMCLTLKKTLFAFTRHTFGFQLMLPRCRAWAGCHGHVASPSADPRTPKGLLRVTGAPPSGAGQVNAVHSCVILRPTPGWGPLGRVPPATPGPSQGCGGPGLPSSTAWKRPSLPEGLCHSATLQPPTPGPPSHRNTSANAPSSQEQQDTAGIEDHGGLGRPGPVCPLPLL